MNQNNVLGFDIAMKYFMFVHEGYSIKEVAYDERCALFSEFLSVGDDVIELSIATQFQYGIEVLFVCEVAVSLDDVGVF